MKFYILILLFLLFSGIPLSAEKHTGISHLASLPCNIEKEKVPLAGKWSFHTAPEKYFWEKGPTAEWRDIEVPGEWVMQGYNVPKGKAAGYFRDFKLPAEWEGRRIMLRCNGVYSQTDIYVNGKTAGSHLGGFTAFELDVTDLAQPGQKNSIALSVISETIADSTSRASIYAEHPLGGITRDIYLYSLPDTHISMFHVSTVFDPSYKDATLIAEIELKNSGLQNTGSHWLRFDLRDPDGRKIWEDDTLIETRGIRTGETQQLALHFPVVHPKKWDAEHPELYTFFCTLVKDGKDVHRTVRRVGFRQVEIRGNRMFINNMPVKLRGICHHEVMPLRGRSMNGNMWEEDVQLFRKGNVNYFRTSHYPPDEKLLDACDALGIFVEVEAPFCWAHRTAVPDSLRYEILVKQHMEMLDLCRSHPSVVIWSIANESQKYKEYFKSAAEVVRQTDPTRPRNYSAWETEDDDGELEIANDHYPGPAGPERYRHYNRPVVFDEFCHINDYNRRELATDPGVRDMWCALLDNMWNDMYHSEGVLGGALWSGIDDSFFLPDGSIAGYGPWGPVDGWRRPKPEYWGMKKAFSPVKVSMKKVEENKGKVVFDVENRHCFSNLKETRLVWKCCGAKGTVSPDVEPGERGEFSIPLARNLQPGDFIELEITGVRGFNIDSYRFQLQAEVPEENGRRTRTRSADSVRLYETPEAYWVQTGPIRFRIDRSDGKVSADADGKELLSEGPSLMVLPLKGGVKGNKMKDQNMFLDPYNPLCSDWKMENLHAVREKDEVRIEVRGKYKEAEGSFSYSIRNAGDVLFRYEFKMLDTVSPRQTGLVFTFPGTFNRLSWERKGYWNVYPENSIAALKGEAVAWDPSLPLSSIAGSAQEPRRAWAYDQTAAGSNIFRSTKENVLKAFLKENRKIRMEFISDGKQHIRAWKEGASICFLAADYNNPGNEPFMVSHSEKYYRTLKPGDSISGCIHMRFP